MREDVSDLASSGWVGVVERVEGAVAYVQIPSPVGCSCGEGAGGGCCSTKTITVRAAVGSTRGLRPGDRVTLAPPQGNPLMAGFLVLGLPVTLGILAYALASGLPTPGPALVAVGAFFLGLLPPLAFRRPTASLPRVVQARTLYAPLKT